MYVSDEKISQGVRLSAQHLQSKSHISHQKQAEKRKKKQPERERRMDRTRSSTRRKGGRGGRKVNKHDGRREEEV
jgi:hypothetical protein